MDKEIRQDEVLFKNFTPAEVAITLKAIISDGISMLMMKNLSQKVIDYLAMVFKMSMKSLIIPNFRKNGRLFSILKSRKVKIDGTQGVDAKLLEDLPLAELTTLIT